MLPAQPYYAGCGIRAAQQDRLVLSAFQGSETLRTARCDRNGGFYDIAYQWNRHTMPLTSTESAAGQYCASFGSFGAVGAIVLFPLVQRGHYEDQKHRPGPWCIR